MSGGGGGYTRVIFNCHVCNLEEVKINKGILGRHNLVANIIVTFDNKSQPVRYSLLSNYEQCVGVKHKWGEREDATCIDGILISYGIRSGEKKEVTDRWPSLNYPPELFNLVSQLNPFPPYTIDGYDRKTAFKKLLECSISKEEPRNKISKVEIQEYDGHNDIQSGRMDFVVRSNKPLQYVSIEKGWFGGWKLSCYDGKNYKDTVNFGSDDPFGTLFIDEKSFTIPFSNTPAAAEAKEQTAPDAEAKKQTAPDAAAEEQTAPDAAPAAAPAAPAAAEEQTAPDAAPAAPAAAPAAPAAPDAAAEEQPAPDAEAKEQPAQVNRVEFENNRNEEGYGFYIAQDRNPFSEKNYTKEGDYTNLLFMAGKLEPPLKDEFEKVVRIGGRKSVMFDTNVMFNTNRLLMGVLEKNKRKLPTENEKKLMKWNEDIYNQEKTVSTETLKDEL